MKKEVFFTFMLALAVLFCPAKPSFAGNSLYHATKFGIEGFCESVAQEVAPFNIDMTIVEPGGGAHRISLWQCKSGQAYARV